MQKICPFMSAWSPERREPSIFECQREKCELWTYSSGVTPLGTEAGCAFRINAMANSEDKIPI